VLCPVFSARKALVFPPEVAHLTDNEFFASENSLPLILFNST
jgi:hypothetical protein